MIAKLKVVLTKKHYVMAVGGSAPDETGWRLSMFLVSLEVLVSAREEQQTAK